MPEAKRLVAQSAFGASGQRFGAPLSARLTERLGRLSIQKTVVASGLSYTVKRIVALRSLESIHDTNDDGGDSDNETAAECSRNESKETLAMYGVEQKETKAFSTNCLLARRLVERGTRFVMLMHASWDHHSNIVKGLQTQTKATDQGAAALIKDLKQRGMLEDTLVVWGGEFGRTAMSELRRPDDPANIGRDHHPNGYSMWMAGGGIKGGQVIGRTDDLSLTIAEDKVHVHDLQATILHCLGMDHTKLTYRFRGRDFRLTDVHGEVVKKLLV